MIQKHPRTICAGSFNQRISGGISARGCRERPFCLVLLVPTSIYLQAICQYENTKIQSDLNNNFDYLSWFRSSNVLSVGLAPSVIGREPWGGSVSYEEEFLGEGMLSLLRILLRSSSENSLIIICITSY